MARYKRNGVWRACRVSTGDPNDCKEAWNKIKAEQSVEDVSEFKPTSHVQSTRTLGLITSTGEVVHVI